MDYRAMFDKQHLGAWDLADRETGKPRDVTLTIEKVHAGTVGHGQKASKKPVISFRGTKKTLACNVTNAAAIAGMYGNNTTKWIGQKITLYPTTTTFGRETVDCVRVRTRAPAKNAASEELGEGNPVDPEMREKQNRARDDFDPESGEVPADQEPPA